MSFDSIAIAGSIVAAAVVLLVKQFLPTRNKNGGSDDRTVNLLQQIRDLLVEDRAEDRANRMMVLDKLVAIEQKTGAIHRRFDEAMARRDTQP